MAVNPLPYILLSNLQIQEPTTHKTHPQHCTINPSNPPNYPIASLSPIAENLFYYTLVNPSFSANLDPYNSLIDQPPPSILPSEASSALPSETNSTLASDSDLPSLSSTKAVK